MSKKRNNLVQKVCVSVGIGLLTASVLLLVLWQGSIRTAQTQATEHVHTLRTLMPEPQGTALQARYDNTMATLTLDCTDYIGILEMPQHGSTLPVSAAWRKLTRQPCRFDGSLYDGSLMIGATSQKGQYDFYRAISVGDAVYFTDMEGNRCAFTVSDIRFEKHADQTALARKDADLTLFIQNVYAFEYIVIFCDTAA